MRPKAVITSKLDSLSNLEYKCKTVLELGSILTLRNVSK